MKSQGKTILIVDSDKEHRERTTRILRGSGFRVLEARGYRDGENVWQLHRSEIALLVTAMVLPDRNGYELTDRIRSVNPAVKVLFISGATGALISEFHDKKLAGTDTLFRPFEPSELVRKVMALLENGLSSAATL